MDGAGVDSIVDVDAGKVAVWADENPGIASRTISGRKTGSFKIFLETSPGAIRAFKIRIDCSSGEQLARQRTFGCEH